MHQLNPEQVTDLLRRRRSIFPETYTEQPIPEEIIREMLENANWAPTHKKTEPWRFQVFRGAGRERLADYLGDWWGRNTPPEEQSEMKRKKFRDKPLQADTVVAICMQRDPKESLPEWEEIAAVACAVQNMWLTCTAYDIGCYWSSPRAILEATDFLELQPGERCLGLFYMGYHQTPEFARQRGPVEEKTRWRLSQEGAKPRG